VAGVAGERRIAQIPTRRTATKQRKPKPIRERSSSMPHAAPIAPSKIRVVVAKPGLDGHDRGAKIIARALRDAGMEVIYTGLHQTPEQIVETVIQEDADAVGLSILSGAHMTLVPRVVELLREQGVDDVVITVGGTIPAEDIPELKSLGVAEVFTPGAPTQAIVDFIRGATGGRASSS
jgi:methylmalonyl-CoA mutase C-terminal domain/subunit